MYIGRFPDEILRKKSKNKHFLESILAILAILKEGSLDSKELYTRRPIARADTFYSYLRLLLRHKLIEKEESVYRITEEGLRFLKVFS
jgi:predicted transcriptional regulator